MCKLGENNEKKKSLIFPESTLMSSAGLISNYILKDIQYIMMQIRGNVVSAWMGEAAARECFVFG